MQEILHAYDEGHSALFVVGRSLYDFVVEDGKLRPMVEAMRRAIRQRFGMALLRYSLAGGLDWDEVRMDDERDRRTVRGVLQAHQLLETRQNDNEPIRIIRGIVSLCRTPTEGLQWADGTPMRFAFLFEFSEHLTPGLLNGTQTPEQVVAIELTHMLAQSLALRSSGNLVILHSRADGLADELVSSALHRIWLPQPDAGHKEQFLGAALDVYDKASFAEGLKIPEVARLTARTPNRGLEALVRASHRTARPIATADFVAQKNRDVEEVSEHTLSVLDTSRIDGLDLRGRNIEVPRRILTRFAEGLRKGDAHMPAQVLLAGAPGTGKTDLAIFTAAKAQVSAYSMQSPKGGIVGETERKCRLQYHALREWVPNVAFLDEATEAMPLTRSDFDGDSGASRAVTAAMLTALSDESRRGRSLLIATTNCPWRMGAAMRSRFTLVPVLHPLANDCPVIIAAMVCRINGTKLDPADKIVAEAAALFHQKNANPRQIRSALSNALLLKGCLTPEATLFAAKDLCASYDMASGIYSDLWAIKACSSLSFLPWSEDPTNYDYPKYLDGVIDKSSGEPILGELEKSLELLRPHANV
jgi:hypothetical protein